MCGKKACAREGCDNSLNRNAEKFCSHKCYTLSRIKHHPYLKECESPVCDNMFVRTRDREKYCSERCVNRKYSLPVCLNPECENKVAKSRNRYCSRSCYAKVRRGAVCSVLDTGEVIFVKHDRVICKLPGCENVVTGRQRVGYCSKECADLGRRKWPEIPCKNCTKTFKPPRPRQVFCSAECAYAYRVATGRAMSLLALSDAAKTGKLQKELEDAE